MNLLHSALQGNFVLTKPQTNLVNQLAELGVSAPSTPTALAINPVTGLRKEIPSFLATLVNWTFDVYMTYDPVAANPMTYRGQRVTVQTWDRVRNLILSLNSEVYRNFID